MKITKEHFLVLENAINQVLVKHNSNNELIYEYENGYFARSEKTIDLQKRFCFDLLFGAGITGFIVKKLYPYLNDDHIYTALKAIVPKLKDKRMEHIK
tara:strand:+ start:23 stop:316 length:294 start_codon:yes stop_codon:yes gene_type:complete